MKDILAIVGSHPRAEQTFDFSRADCDVWVFNEALHKPFIQRADAVFQLHVEEIWRNPKNRNDPNHVNWLLNKTAPCNICNGKGEINETPCHGCKAGTYKPSGRAGVTVYMQKAYVDIPGSVAYPLNEVTDLLGAYVWEWDGKSGNTDSFTSSIPFAIALGILNGYRRIELHGIELETNTEYMFQRDGMTFWKGVAVGRGVELIHYTPQFVQMRVYGFDGEAQLDISQFEKRIADLVPVLDDLKKKYEQIVRDADKAVTEFTQNGKDENKVAETFKAQVKMAHEIHIISGAMQENDKYLAKAKAMMEASGGRFQFSRQEFEAAMQSAGKEHQKALTNASAAAGAADALFKEAAKQKNFNRRKTKMREFANAARGYLQQSMFVGLWQGVGSENNMLLSLVDQMVKAAGGEKSEQVFMERVKQDA